MYIANVKLYNNQSFNRPFQYFSLIKFTSNLRNGEKTELDVSKLNQFNFKLLIPSLILNSPKIESFLIQVISTVPKDLGSKSTIAEMRLHPSGGFLFVANRGDNSIAVFRWKTVKESFIRFFMKYDLKLLEFFPCVKNLVQKCLLILQKN